MEKLCPGCKRTLPLTPHYFNRRSARKGGFQSRCRDCQSAYYRANREAHKAAVYDWRERNRERSREISREGYQRNRERERERKRRCYAANSEKEKQRAKDYRRRTAEARKEYRRRYYAANRDLCLARNRSWLERHRDEHLAKQRAYSRAHPERHAKRKALADKTRNGRIDWRLIIARDGDTCHICKLPVERSEREFDHVIPLDKGGTHTTDNLAVTHRTCNRRKAAGLLGRG